MRIAIPLMLLVLAAAVPAQTEGEPATQDPEAVLAAVDRRIYRAQDDGLAGFRFRVAMGEQASGLLAEALKGLAMELSFQKPDRWRLRLLDAQGEPLAKEPEFFATEQGRELRDAWELNLKGLAQHFVWGIGWQERYRDYHKQMKRYLVNDKVEYRLTMNPKKKGPVATVVLKIVSGLPREIVQIGADGGRYVARYHFEAREDLGGRHLLVGTKHEVENVQILDESYEYLTRKGFVVLAGIRRLASSGEFRDQRFRFENMEIDPDFPAGWFPERKDRAEEEKPAPAADDEEG